MKTKLVFGAAIIFQFVFASCSSSSFTSLETLKKDLNLKSFPDQEKYPDADAVILWEEHDVHARINDEYQIVTDVTVTKRTKIFRNIDDYASVEIPVYSGDKLTDISARTIKPDGSAVELKESDFHTIAGAAEGYIFYSDAKKVKFTFPAVEKNSILEYRYTIHESRPFVEDVWDIQNTIPILRNTYALTVPIILMAPQARGGLDWTWRYKWYNTFPCEPTVVRNLTPSQLTTDQTVTYTWSKSDVPAFKPDPMMGSYFDYVEHVKFSPSEWKSWNDISGWYYKYLFRPQLVVTDEITNKAEKLTLGCKTETEKIRKIYEFVQGLRYVAIELGIGGFQPAKPQDVLDRMYGDCKDKSILLISLLKSLDIKAKPVLVLTSDYGKVDPDFPTWTFNHMIVKATTEDGTGYWMDPTVDHCMLGELPYLDQGTTALILNGDNTSTLEKIPSENFRSNGRDIHVLADLRNPGQTTFDVDMRFKGQENLKMKYFFADKSRDDIMKYCKSMVADQSLDAEVIHYSIGGLDPDSILDFRFSLSLPGLIETQGNLAFPNIDLFRLTGNWTWLAQNERKYDIRFDYPRQDFKTIEVVLPENRYKVRDMPQNVVLGQDGLYYDKQYEAEQNGHILIKEAFMIMQDKIKAKDVTEVKEFVRSMKTEGAQKIILTTKQN